MSFVFVLGGKDGFVDVFLVAVTELVPDGLHREKKTRRKVSWWKERDERGQRGGSVTHSSSGMNSSVVGLALRFRSEKRCESCHGSVTLEDEASKSQC